MPRRKKAARLTNKELVLRGLYQWPELARATNQEIADALFIHHPVSVSQALSGLHKDGKIRVWFDGELYPIRHIDLLADPSDVRR